MGAMTASPSAEWICAPPGNDVQLSKIGLIKIQQHRPIEGAIKTLSIRRAAVGSWYALLRV